MSVCVCECEEVLFHSYTSCVKSAKMLDVISLNTLCNVINSVYASMSVFTRVPQTNIIMVNTETNDIRALTDINI